MTDRYKRAKHAFQAFQARMDVHDRIMGKVNVLKIVLKDLYIRRAGLYSREILVAQ